MKFQASRWRPKKSKPGVGCDARSRNKRERSNDVPSKPAGSWEGRRLGKKAAAGSTYNWLTKKQSPIQRSPVYVGHLDLPRE